MKKSEVLSIIKELIAEEKAKAFEGKLFGKKFILDFGDSAGEEQPYEVLAIISTSIKGPKSDYPYRMSLFRGEGELLEADGHIPITKGELEYIIFEKKLSRRIELWIKDLYGEIPKIKGSISEVKRTGPIHPSGADILVGTIDKEDGYVDAKFGGTHKTMKVRNNPQGDWRFNDETRIVYWHSAHPRIYERYVDAYIENNLGMKVKQHLTLDNLASLPDVYQRVWNDMHGVDSND